MCGGRWRREMLRSFTYIGEVTRAQRRLPRDAANDHETLTSVSGKPRLLQFGEQQMGSIYKGKSCANDETRRREAQLETPSAVFEILMERTSFTANQHGELTNPYLQSQCNEKRKLQIDRLLLPRGLAALMLIFQQGQFLNTNQVPMSQNLEAGKVVALFANACRAGTLYQVHI